MKVWLPTGRTALLQLAKKPRSEVAPAPPGAGPTLFAEALWVMRESVTLDGQGDDVQGLSLVDFHALRAILTHEGALDEEVVTIGCLNCGASIEVSPCKSMPLGPFLEGALNDEELDARLAPDEVSSIPEIALAGGAVAREAVFVDRTVSEAMPLWRALGEGSLPFQISADAVTAMGLSALGAERDPARIAAALRGASDEAVYAMSELFLSLHYPLRLGGVARCAACGARNDVDAPFDREFALGDAASHIGSGGSEEAPFVDFETFDARAKALFEETLPKALQDEIMFVVEGGVAAVDDGGVPLLGSYLPATPGDGASPSRSHEVAVYYRTFRAIWQDEGPFDWESELAETLDHEIEHLVATLRGHDETDEEERREIDEEAARLHGRHTLLAGEVSGLLSDVAGFLRRTWPLWLIVLALAMLMAFSQE